MNAENKQNTSANPAASTMAAVAVAAAGKGIGVVMPSVIHFLTEKIHNNKG